MNKKLFDKIFNIFNTQLIIMNLLFWGILSTIPHTVIDHLFIDT